MDLRNARLMIAGGTASALAAYASAFIAVPPPMWGVWAMIAGIALMFGGMLALGSRQSGVPLRVVTLATIVLLVIVVAGFGIPLLLPDDAINAPLWLGLPRRAAIEVYGVGVLPLFIFPVAYALTFREAGLDDASLAALRDECEMLRNGPGTS